MNNRKKIAICGASWFTSDLAAPGSSFGEKLAKKVDFDLISLARGGCSNFTISLQVDKAIELRADYVVVGTDTCDRIEIPILDSSNEEIKDYIKRLFKWDTWWEPRLKFQNKWYKPGRGLSNIQYKPHRDLSSNHEFLKDPTIISESMNNLAFSAHGTNNFYNLTDDQVSALKSYMLYLYDYHTKQQQDCWIISDACRRLQQSQIPFIIFVHPLFVNAYERNINWLPTACKVSITEFDYRSLTGGPLRFHYDLNESDKFADFVIQKLNLLEEANP
jgi:hypothetical protein